MLLAPDEQGVHVWEWVTAGPPSSGAPCLGLEPRLLLGIQSQHPHHARALHGSLLHPGTFAGDTVALPHGDAGPLVTAAVPVPIPAGWGAPGSSSGRRPKCFHLVEEE